MELPILVCWILLISVELGAFGQTSGDFLDGWAEYGRGRYKRCEHETLDAGLTCKLSLQLHQNCTIRFV